MTPDQKEDEGLAPKVSQVIVEELPTFFVKPKEKERSYNLNTIEELRSELD